MLLNNRLDYISDIDPQFIDIMTDLRKDFISLDSRIRLLGSLECSKREGVARCLSLARTNIETALQQAIKALCLMGEIHEDRKPEQVL
jgi:hypothetical protein